MLVIIGTGDDLEGLVPNSFEYEKPWLIDNPEPPVCPHCRQEIQPGDNVHWYQDTLWHTKPCPS